MYKGDLSNNMPKRVLVSNTLFTDLTETIVRKWFKKKSIKDVSYDNLFLNKLYHYTVTSGVTLELISYELNEDELTRLYNELDRVGVNPFRYHSSYKTINELVSQLPYRPEVIGVLDLPQKQLMYGHWGLDL
jgi:hypothetical protein